MSLTVEQASVFSRQKAIPWLELSALAALLAILFVRLADLNYNTAFVDEAIYITNGQQALRGTSSFVGVRYMFGSYLYPVLAAVFGNLFGDELLGARVLSALSTTAAALGVYVLARRLFGGLAGALAMLCFGFAANARLVGQLATYDTLGVGFLGLAAPLLVLGLTETNPEQAERYTFFAAVAFALSVLAKYIALLMVPPLVLLGALLLFARDWRRVGLLVRHFVVPLALILAAYGMIFLDDLLLFVQGIGQLSSQPAARQDILNGISEAMWLLSTLGVAGLAAFVLGPRLMLNKRTSLRASSEAFGLQCTPVGRLGIAMLLASAALVLPVYHLGAGNIRSMDKHIAYALIFLAPLAGCALSAVFGLATWLLPSAWRSGLVQALFVAACGVGSFWYGNTTTQALKQLWPNEQRTLAFVGRLPMPLNTRVLAEGGNTYAMYFDWDDRVRLTDTWATSFYYKTYQGANALLPAVQDRAFAYIILDRFYTPETSAQIDQAARAAGYRVIFQNQVLISNKSQITTTIFAAPSVPTEARYGSN